MKKYLGNLLVAVAALTLCACGEKESPASHPVLKLALEEQDVSIHDVFSKVEVIPLETNDECLIAMLYAVNYHDGRYGILDWLNRGNIINYYLFDEKGKFMTKVGNLGQGPGEYSEVYSASHDERNGDISLLSPFGFVYQYTADGKFIRKQTLPSKANYQKFVDAGDYFVTWSTPFDCEDKAISLIDKADMGYIKGYVSGNREMFFSSRLFKYEGNVYFSHALSRNVYRIDKDTMTVAYEWDFGKDNYAVSDFGISEMESSPDDKVFEKYRDRTIPYILSERSETDKFYYTKVSLGTEKQCHVFYHKADGSTHYFYKTTEGIELKPKYWGNTFMISLVEDEEDLGPYRKILPQEEQDKLKDRKEDENPVLVKCYYK